VIRITFAGEPSQPRMQRLCTGDSRLATSELQVATLPAVETKKIYLKRPFQLQNRPETGRCHNQAGHVLKRVTSLWAKESYSILRKTATIILPAFGLCHSPQLDCPVSHLRKIYRIFQCVVLGIIFTLIFLLLFFGRITNKKAKERDHRHGFCGLHNSSAHRPVPLFRRLHVALILQIPFIEPHLFTR
jgi:hypothetical protein